jgi:hypothetical protein
MGHLTPGTYSQVQKGYADTLLAGPKSCLKETGKVQKFQGSGFFTNACFFSFGLQSNPGFAQEPGARWKLYPEKVPVDTAAAKRRPMQPG